jgi:hypothetical protein
MRRQPAIASLPRIRGAFSREAYYNRHIANNYRSCFHFIGNLLVGGKS